jgi:hypothetical protein
MKMFYQRADIVQVLDETERYIETPDNFRADYGKDLPTLPEGAIDRMYVPGQKHALHDAVGDIMPNDPQACPREYPEGDAIIASIYTLQRARIAREKAAALAKTEADFKKLQDNLAEAVAAVEGGFASQLEEINEREKVAAGTTTGK